MKKIKFTFPAILILFSLINIFNSAYSQEVDFTGTVKYFNLEGGFYGIVSDENKGYLPNNLQNEYKVDGLRVKVSGKVLDVMTTQMWGTPISITGISQVEKIQSLKGFEVHEWGVLAGCEKTKNYFLTSRPEQSYMIKLPVVYFHFPGDKFPFSMKVDFLKGKPTDTYPQAINEEMSFSWENVSFPDNDIKKSNVGISEDFIPLKDIIPVLNDVDAEELLYKGTKSKFLFYEGEMDFTNNISVKLDDDKNVAFYNSGDYPVYCLTYAKGAEKYGLPNQASELFCLDSLYPGETKTGTLYKSNEFKIKKTLTSDRTCKKFTDSQDKISQLLLIPGLTKHKDNLIYRIPVDVYNSMVKLKFTPEPEKISRVLYILMHID